jgi:hypothetical protein
MLYTSLKQRSRPACWPPIVFLLLVPLSITAQVRWDGEGGDGQWTTALNWVGNQLPAATDDVLLDNSLVAGNYIVYLPGAVATVTVKTITILPAGPNTIQLSLPASSMVAPALTTTGPGYGIVINNGGLLLNSSTVPGGDAIVVNDSIRINNGGQYTHNTRSAHAALVTVLSKQPGTEKGIFKFDPPGGGYTFATTNRTYGTLMLSAAASGGNLVYASSAANPFTVNGDFIIEPGVTVNLDITAATIIKGNYLQQGGVFNLASQPNNNTVFIKGDIIQKAGAITETSTGMPSIELNGTANQNVEATGAIVNSVGLTINNAAGVTLQSGLSLPFRLSLLKGIINTQSFVLTLLAGCTIAADSTSNTSFVNGILRKEGLAATPYFLFPVGKGSTQRWLELRNAAGNYTVEFFKSNPHALSIAAGSGIHHFSSIEYWSVAPDAAPSPSGSVELSFDNVNSGGVTDLTTLRVAQLQAGSWTDAGNSAASGSAGSAGAVVSNAIVGFQLPVNYFTLASSDAFQNPLPIQLVSFNAVRNNDVVDLKWVINRDWHPAFFELESSGDGRHFVMTAIIPAAANQSVYQYTDRKVQAGTAWYRLKIVEQDQSILFSDKIKLPEAVLWPILLLQPSLVKTDARLTIYAAANEEALLIILAADGKMVNKRQLYLQAGVNNILMNAGHLPAGTYTVTIHYNNTMRSVRFVKTG